MAHTLKVTQSGNSQWRFPTELFSIIFQHACPTPDIFQIHWEPIQTHTFHLVLRLVSKLWYNIVQSTPQLWTSVVLQKLCTENADIKGRFLKLCLDNSGGLPLTLSCQFEWMSRGILWLTSPIVDATLEHNAHRIQALRIIQPPRSWLENLIPKMCQLAMIRIDRPQFFISWASDENDMRLCLPTSVTHVELENVPISLAVEILSRCPNLINFSCRLPTGLEVEVPRTTPRSPFVLNHLSTFTWSTSQVDGSISDWDFVLFKRIRLPALKRFNWWFEEWVLLREPGTTHLSMQEANDVLARSLSRFPTSVTTLQLGGISAYTLEDALGLKMLLPLTGVDHLRFLDCDPIFVEHAFSVLSRKESQSNILFPKLTSIVIDYLWGGWTQSQMEFDESSGDRIAQMLRSRVGLIDELTLTVHSAYLTPNWNQGVWDTLRELKRDGLDLTIIEHGHPIII